MTVPVVWVTRTQPGATRTAERVAALGYVPVVAPLLAIRPAPFSPDVTAAFADAAALAFTSTAAVQTYARLSPGPAAADRSIPVFTVGDTTAAAARELGFQDVRSASGGLDDLVGLIRAHWSIDRGLIVAPGAAQPAGDLAARLDGQARVRALAIYEAVETDAHPPAAFDLVLIHSPRAAAALARRLSPAAAAGRRAAAISPAAAQPLTALGFARIDVAAAPTEAALLGALGKAPPRV